jgi:hypothetical protein
MLEIEGGGKEMLCMASDKGNGHGPQNGPADSVPTGAPEVSTRITVELLRRVAEDLKRTQDRSGLSRTDIVNRALTLYEFIDAELSAGAELFVRQGDQHYLVELLSPVRRRTVPKTSRRRRAPL